MKIGFSPKVSLTERVGFSEVVKCSAESKLRKLSLFCVSCVSPSVGWSRDYRNEGFGEQNTIKMRLINLISSVRTLLRGKSLPTMTCRSCW